MLHAGSVLRKGTTTAGEITLDLGAALFGDACWGSAQYLRHGGFAFLHEPWMRVGAEDAERKAAVMVLHDVTIAEIETQQIPVRLIGQTLAAREAVGGGTMWQSCLM